MTSRQPIGEREAICHAAAVVGKLETMRAAPELLGAPTTGGGSARPRGGDGEIPRSHINLIKNGEKTGGFAHVLA
jgi:hypothetical protein